MFEVVSAKELLWVDTDIEARPLGWYGGDFVHKEITAIAAKIIGQKKMYLWYLPKHTPEEMLEGFLELYNRADVITGHYVRGFDLPTINGALFDFGMSPLHDKMVQDTKTDLIRMDGLSKSMENLGSIMRLNHPKITMTQQDWRDANRLTPRGVELVKKRVTGDVEEHIELRERLLKQGALGRARMWYSVGPGKTEYTP